MLLCMLKFLSQIAVASEEEQKELKFNLPKIRKLKLPENLEFPREEEHIAENQEITMPMMEGKN